MRTALGDTSPLLHMADMAEVGANPARILPAWRDFVEAQTPGQTFRGIGEPIWAARSPDELAESQRHEQLVNVAFEDAPAWWLLCLYDTTCLEASVLDEAARSHPYVVSAGEHRSSDHYRNTADFATFDWPLRDPSTPYEEIAIGARKLRPVRSFVAHRAARAGFDPARVADIVLAAHELATNSVRYGGGAGVLRMWKEGSTLLIESRDKGSITKPLAGRERPGRPRESGYGLWLANQLSDLVQIRTFSEGSVVRLHFKTA